MDKTHHGLSSAEKGCVSLAKQSDLRDYENAPSHVRLLYSNQRKKQTFSHYQYCVTQYCRFNTRKPVSFWEIFDVYAQCIDLSDPDTSISNKHHAFQVAEAIRAAGRPQWEQLIGLLHDIGKYIHIYGSTDDGTTLDTQWSIVGDTYILGIPLPIKSVPFSDIKSRYEDSPSVNENGCCYWHGCGLMNTVTTFGHDEVLYRWLLKNTNTLPTAAYYIARYHSLYPWHSGGAYSEFENDKDRRYKTDVQRFQSYDLYTKTDTMIDIESLKPYYNQLISKFFRRPNQLYW